MAGQIAPPPLLLEDELLEELLPLDDELLEDELLPLEDELELLVLPLGGSSVQATRPHSTKLTAMSLIN
ncbi:MAG: hypothetical protein RL497_93 [Pseudomonadota bacterium]